MLEELLQGECTSADTPLNQDEIKELCHDVPAWDCILDNGASHLRHEYKFANYEEALLFINKVSELAQQHEHHPKMIIEWKKVTVEWWTTALNGLHRNDFIMAAKTDEIYRRWDAVAGKKDKVQLASEQSFPASDPPGRNEYIDEPV